MLQRQDWRLSFASSFFVYETYQFAFSWIESLIVEWFSHFGIFKLNNLWSQVEVTRDLQPKASPHYMEKKNSFISKSILGKIYDEVNAYLEEDHSNNGEFLN